MVGSEGLLEVDVLGVGARPARFIFRTFRASNRAYRQVLDHRE